MLITNREIAPTFCMSSHCTDRWDTACNYAVIMYAFALMGVLLFRVMHKITIDQSHHGKKTLLLRGRKDKGEFQGMHTTPCIQFASLLSKH